MAITMPCVLQALMPTTKLMHENGMPLSPTHVLSVLSSGATCHHLIRPFASCPHAKCHHMIHPFASKYVKSRLSQNSTEFDCVPRFCETNSTAWSALSTEIYRNFQTYSFYYNENRTFYFTLVFTFFPS